jgi:hypothetical protein
MMMTAIIACRMTLCDYLGGKIFGAVPPLVGPLIYDMMPW